VSACDQDSENTGNGSESTSDQTGETTGSDQLKKQARPATTPSVSTGITVQNPDDLTDKVTGQLDFNVDTSSPLQYTFDHTDAKGVSTDLRAYDGYSSKYQVQGAGTWLGETYANNIAQDAKGMDINSPLQYSDGSHPLYIDEWLPDYALQTFLWLANYKFNPNKPGIFQWQSVDDVFLMVVD